MSMEIKNKLNIWKWKEPYRWYRIDKKIGFFFRKVKWAWQRAKYGYCDRDLWDLDHTLGNYIASSVNKLADITHGYPHGTTPEVWDGILRSIARNFYLGTDEDEWGNPYEEELFKDSRDEVESREVFNKWVKVEEENYQAMQVRRQEGFNLLQKWYTDLWD